MNPETSILDILARPEELLLTENAVSGKVPPLVDMPVTQSIGILSGGTLFLNGIDSMEMKHTILTKIPEGF